MKGYRTYTALFGTFLATTSSLLISLGILGQGLSPEQISSITVWLDGAIAFGIASSTYFRSLATKKK